MNERLATVWIAVLVLAGCSGDPLATVGLGPLEFVNTDDFEPQIRSQLEMAEDAVAVAARAGHVDSTGMRLGELGRLYLLYRLPQPASELLRVAAEADSSQAYWWYYLGLAFRDLDRMSDAAEAFATHNRMVGDVAGRIREAEMWVALGQDDVAAAILDAALLQDSTSALALYNRGQIAEAAGDDIGAVEYYRAVLRHQPQASVVKYALGMAYRRIGREADGAALIAQRGTGRIVFEDTLVQKMEALRTGSQALAQDGIRFLNAGRVEDALRVLAEAVSANPENGAAQLNLGVAFYQAGDPSRARGPLEEALRIDPGDARARYLLGVISESTGDYAEALDRYHSAVASDGTFADAYLGLARVQWKTGDCGAAVPNYDALLRIEPGHPDHVETRLRRAMCRVKVGQDVAARAELERDVAGFPEEDLLLDALVRILAASPDDAVRDGSQAVQLGERLLSRTDHFQTRTALSLAYAEAGKKAEALEQLERAISQSAGSPEIVSTYLRVVKRTIEKGTPIRLPWPDFLYGR